MTNSKQKGKRGELEIAKILKGYGYDCRRTAQYNGKEQGSLADVVGLPGYHIEVKRVESGLKKMDDFMEQAVRDCQGEVPTIWHRRNNKEWLVTMRLTDWIELYGGAHDKEEK